MNAEYAFGYYTAKGVPAHVAAAIVGNLAVESRNFAPSIISGTKRGDNGRAWYVGQWHADRKTKFENFASKTGRVPTDLNAQLDFVLEEMNPKSPYRDVIAAKNRDKVMAAKTVEEATSAFAKHVSRAGVPHIDRRTSVANTLAGKPPAAVDLQPLRNAYEAVVPARSVQTTSLPSGRTIEPGLGLQNLVGRSAPGGLVAGKAVSPFDQLVPDTLAPPGRPRGMELAHQNLTDDVPYGRVATANMQPITGAVIHHSVEKTLSGIRNVTNSPRAGGAYIGYTYAIDPKGNVGLLAPLDKRTNHIGQVPSSLAHLTNSNSIGITLLDAHSKATPAQIAAAGELISALNRAGLANIQPESIAYHGKGATDARSVEGKAEAEAIRDYLGGSEFGRHTPVPTPRPDVSPTQVSVGVPVPSPAPVTVAAAAPVPSAPVSRASLPSPAVGARAASEMQGFTPPSAPISVPDLAQPASPAMGARAASELQGYQTPPAAMPAPAMPPAMAPAREIADRTVAPPSALASIMAPPSTMSRPSMPSAVPPTSVTTSAVPLASIGSFPPAPMDPGRKARSEAAKGALLGLATGGLPGAILGGLLGPARAQISRNIAARQNPFSNIFSSYRGMFGDLGRFSSIPAPNYGATPYSVGSGYGAIGSVFGAPAGATATSRSNPEVSFTSLGNGYVSRSNSQYGTSYTMGPGEYDAGMFGGGSKSGGKGGKK